VSFTVGDSVEYLIAAVNFFFGIFNAFPFRKSEASQEKKVEKSKKKFQKTLDCSRLLR
jgi:hypothetical protein